jgi:hypothetical protein
MVKWSIVWSIVTLATHDKWDIFHFNVKTVFLDGDLKEEVYMTQLKGFVIPGQEIISWKLYMGFEMLLKPSMKKMICILKTKVFYKMMQIIIFTTP